MSIWLARWFVGFVSLKRYPRLLSQPHIPNLLTIINPQEQKETRQTHYQLWISSNQKRKFKQINWFSCYQETPCGGCWSFIGPKLRRRRRKWRRGNEGGYGITMIILICSSISLSNSIGWQWWEQEDEGGDWGSSKWVNSVVEFNSIHSEFPNYCYCCCSFLHRPLAVNWVYDDVVHWP